MSLLPTKSTIFVQRIYTTGKHIIFIMILIPPFCGFERKFKRFSAKMWASFYQAYIYGTHTGAWLAFFLNKHTNAHKQSKWLCAPSTHPMHLWIWVQWYPSYSAVLLDMCRARWDSFDRSWDRCKVGVLDLKYHKPVFILIVLNRSDSPILYAWHVINCLLIWKPTYDMK
jgi:hypothetical protein